MSGSPRATWLCSETAFHVPSLPVTLRPAALAGRQGPGIEQLVSGVSAVTLTPTVRARAPQTRKHQALLGLWAFKALDGCHDRGSPYVVAPSHQPAPVRQHAWLSASCHKRDPWERGQQCHRPSQGLPPCPVLKATSLISEEGLEASSRDSSFSWDSSCRWLWR